MNKEMIKFFPKTYSNIDMQAARQVYDVLIEFGYANASSNAEYRFIRYVTMSEWRDYVEYCYEGSAASRFTGDNILGRGGKFRITPTDWHMSCYTEDWTMKRQIIIDTINPMLMEIRRQYIERVCISKSQPE